MDTLDKNENLTPAQIQMKSEKMWLLVLKYSIPTIIGMLVNALYVTIDRFWVGRLPGESGALGLAAIGLSVPIMNMMLAFAQLIAIGAATTISIALGKKDKELAERLLHNSIMLSVLAAVFLNIVVFVFAEYILRFLGANDAVMVYALPYTRITASSALFYVLALNLSSTIRATGNIKIFAFTKLMAAVINMILDPIFIFTFGLGIQGAAYATIVAQFSIALFTIIYYYRDKVDLKIRRSGFKFSYEETKKILSIGISPFLMTASASIVTAIANIQIIRHAGIEFGSGDVGIGAMAIISGVGMIFFMPIIGINQGVQPIIGFNYGYKNYSRFKEAYKWAVIYGAAICLLGSILVTLFPVQIVSIFSSDPLLIEVASEGMRIFLIALPFVAIQSISANLFQAIGQPKISIFLSALRQIILLIPLYIILPRFLGMTGIWIAGPAADTLAIVVTLFFVVKKMNSIKD